MPALHIVHGLPETGPGACIDRFISASAIEPFTTWLILPTRRLVRDVTDRISEKTPVIPSRVCTLDGFCQALFDEHRTTERSLSKTEAKLLLAQVLEDHAAEIPLFVGNGHPSSGTIDDLMTFMNVILTRKVAFPECLVDLQSDKSEQLNIIITAYRERLNTLDLADSDTILEWTIDLLNRSSSSPLGSVFVYGFHQPLPLEQDLFMAIREHAGSASFFVPDGLDPKIFRGGDWTGIPSGSRPVADPASVSSHITGLFFETGARDFGDRFRVQTFPSHDAEVRGIATEICRLNADGIPLADITVAFPELRDELGIVEEVFEDVGIPWHAATGPRLRHEPVIAFLAGIIGLVVTGYAREDVVRLVSSPFFCREPVPGTTARLDPEELDLVLRYALIETFRTGWEDRLNALGARLEDPQNAKNYPGITAHSVRQVQEGMQGLLRALEPLKGKKSLRDHIDGFCSFLQAWNLPNVQMPPDEQTRARETRALTAFLSRLKALSTISWLPADSKKTPGEFLRFVAAISEETVQGAGKDAHGVTVVGIRECEHQHFPVLFIGGMVEGAIPSLTTRLPFTNSLENTRMGTRGLTEILREGQYYFIAALLSGQKTVYLSAPLAEGEKILLTSAFFERVRERAGSVPWHAGNLTVFSQRTAAIHAGECIRDEKTCEAPAFLTGSWGINDLVERINMERYYRWGPCDSPYDGILSGDETIRAALDGRYGPRHVYSPTSLETYAGCPFAYFLERVIGLAALPEIEPNLSAKNRGTVIHSILNTFYRQWRAAGNGKVSPATLKEATDRILTIAAEELGTYTFQSPLWDATKVMMIGNTDAGPGYFEKFLCDESDEADSPLCPAGFELSFGMGSPESDDPASSPEPVEVTSADGLTTMLIRGRIDRIDRTPDGLFLIYDYKTGSQHPKAKDILAGKALQLPLYLLAFETISGNHGIGGGYYTIRREVGRSIVLANETARDLMCSRPRVSADFTGMIQHSRDYAFAYREGIRNGSFPLPCEEECPNNYCAFKRICRFDAYRVFEVREET